MNPATEWCPAGHELEPVSRHGKSRARCRCGRMAHLDERSQAAYHEAARRISHTPAAPPGPAASVGEAPDPPDDGGGAVPPSASEDRPPRAEPSDGHAEGPVREWSPTEIAAPAQLPPDDGRPAEPEPVEPEPEPEPAPPPPPRRRMDLLDLLGGRRAR